MRKLYLFILFTIFVYNVKAEKKDSLLQKISITKIDTIKVNCFNQLSFLYSDNDSVNTIIYATKAYELAQKIQFTKGICEALYNLAYFQQGFKYDYLAAEKFYLQGIKLARKANLLSIEGSGMMEYATNLKSQRKHKESLIINKQLVEIFRKLNDTPNLTKAYNMLGNNYKNLNQFDKSIEALLISLDLAKKSKNNNSVASAYINIGVCYDGNGDYDQALKNYLAAVEPAFAGGNKNYIATNYGNIGTAYMSLNEFAKAIPYMQRALKMHEEQQELGDIAAMLNNLATANNYLKNYKEAINNSTRSLALAKELNDFETSSYAYLSLGVSNQGLNNIALAKANFAKAEGMIDSVNNTAYTMQVYAKVADFYAINKDYKNAFDYYHKLITMRDTIFNAEKHLQISSLQTRYETVEKEKELVKSQSEILQKVVQIQQKDKWLLVSVMGIIVIGMGGFLFWRSAELRRLKEKIEKEKIASEAQSKMHDEKIRISRELHDNIGAQLTFINSSLEHLSPNNAQEIADTKTMTLNTIRELRSIVWLINKEEFYVDELVIKLRDLMKPLQNKKPKIEIICDEKDNPKLNAHIASNLFRIVQEATNNTIKYAQANTLKIWIDLSKIATLLIHIEDDGIGFEYKENNLSFGMKNIVARVANLNGDCNINSSIGNGTKIIISIPID